ncbi:hypothetical protein ORV05_04670 [Amycolatopsis cynarae]|uniref:Uncharacterized protein n=1 Tax=Amycolatopsis cynarae TaxID=2995223 RepID=A0ABY7B440_9PSEU|nr:hypothetical protein [Amycolatopsis sp. HUAS 11-8]WAL67084.1 hypothetical protein ORV05_04670 [Amycolatopsis sp. HUAS 11-8]
MVHDVVELLTLGVALVGVALMCFVAKELRDAIAERRELMAVALCLRQMLEEKCGHERAQQLLENAGLPVKNLPKPAPPSPVRRSVRRPSYLRLVTTDAQWTGDGGTGFFLTESS